MPLLEQRRRSPADSPFRSRDLTSGILQISLALNRNWPLTWALVYLAGFGLGGRLPLEISQPGMAGAWFSWSARGAALLPAVMVIVPAASVLPVWLGVMSCGYLAGSLEAAPRQSRQTALADSPWGVARNRAWKGPAVLRITGWPAPASRQRWRAPARLLYVGNPAQNQDHLKPAIGQGVMITGKGELPPPGTCLTGPVELRVPPQATLPGSFDYRLFLAGRGLTWQGSLTEWTPLVRDDPLTFAGRKFLSPVRKAIVRGLGEFLPAREAGMAGAVLLGIRDAESRTASRPFAELGLAHLFAVSGLHVGILLGIMVLPGQWAGLSPGQRLVPIMLILPVYVLLTGMPGSVVRAASLGFLALAGAALGRPVQALRLVGLLFWAGTVWDPGQNLDTGLKLSYLAAGGILAVSSLTHGLRFTSHRYLGFLLSGVAVSTAAQWFTLPLVAASFGRISSLSLLANLIAVPVFGLAVWCVVLTLMTGILWPAAGESLGALAWFLFRMLAGLTGFISRETGGYPIGLPPPGVRLIALWVVLSGAGLWSLKVWVKGRLSGVAALTLVLFALSLGVAGFGPLSWNHGLRDRVTAWQFDVGQGDCALIVLPDRWTLMIDTAGLFGFGGSGSDGPLSRSVLPFLQRHGVTHLDGVLLTHGHLDHTGGARTLEENLDVGTWYVSGRAGRAVSGLADSLSVVYPKSGQVLHQWNDWELRVAYPPEVIDEQWDENDHSLVVVLSRAGKDLGVWSGDLEVEGEHEMISRGQVPTGVQVWKAGHHGSNTSGSRELMDLLDPKLVLISCGVGNGYRHPSHGPYIVQGDTLAIARTDLQGSIRLEWDPNGVLSWKTMVTETQTIGPP